MTSPDTDFSRPPQWVEGFYKPADLPPHFLVFTDTDNPESYNIRPVTLDGVDMLSFDLHSGMDNLPTLDEGGYSISASGDEELFKELKKRGKHFFLAKEVRERVQGSPWEIVLNHSYASEFLYASGVAASYEDFLAIEQRFQENPEQIANAYAFISNHPVFWRIQTRNGKSYILEGQGFQRLQFDVFQKAASPSESVVTIETGPGRYHDLNLDVSDSTFDGAVIALAKRLLEHYDSHGDFRDKTKTEPNDNFFA